MLIPVAARLKAWVCSRTLVGIVGSSPAGTWMFVSCECCVLSGRSLHRADHLSRFLPSVARSMSVIAKPRNGTPWPGITSKHHRKKKWTCTQLGRDSSVGIATRYGLDGLGIESRWRDIPQPSRPALGPTHPSIQWVPGKTAGAWRWRPILI